ncbi:MAG: retropepsin-like aspartic protease [Pseudomonadota bacterium]
MRLGHSLLKRSSIHGLFALIGICRALSFNPAQATERQSLNLLENARNWPITEIMINGQPSQALLDTGATVALIHDRYLAPGAATESPDATRVQGIGGNRILPVTHVASVKAGAHTWTNLRAVVNAADQFPIAQNILPVALLDGATVDFDFRKSTVELYDGYPKIIPGAERNAIRYRLHGGLIFIPVSINGVSGEALIDTGSTVTFVNAHYAARAGGVKRDQEPEAIQGSDLNRGELEVFEFRKMRLGDKRISTFSIPVLETDLFASLGFDQAPMMVIGMDLLSHYRLQIDRKRERIVLVR